MFNRIFFFLLGFGLMIIGFTYIIIYLNLFTFGYNFLEYLIFIHTRIECLCTHIGFIILTLAIYIKGGKYNGQYL